MLPQAEELNLIEINGKLEKLSAEERLHWGFEIFGEGILFSSSFGALSAGLCHLVATVAPGTPVYFLETGFHFPETLVFRDELIARLPLKLEILEANYLDKEKLADMGPEPYRTNPDRCCQINKVAPFERALEGKSAWISGVRRSQNDHRAALDFLTRTENGKLKLHPILDWSTKQLYEYIQQHNLPVHPLWEKGYTSIGCGPCTHAPLDPGDERSGRWAGTGKTECGLHRL